MKRLATAALIAGALMMVCGMQISSAVAKERKYQERYCVCQHLDLNQPYLGDIG
jgi:hypothetical protein